MGRTKADFRALREQVGMSQALLARELDVDVRSVKRWENPDNPWEPPADAWTVLDDAHALQVEVVGFAISKAEEIAEAAGHKAGVVTLSYFRDAVHYEAAHPGEGSRWQMANANSRLAADRLEMAGYTVRFAYGDVRGVGGNA